MSDLIRFDWRGRWGLGAMIGGMIAIWVCLLLGYTVAGGVIVFLSGFAILTWAWVRESRARDKEERR